MSILRKGFGIVWWSLLLTLILTFLSLDIYFSTYFAWKNFFFNLSLVFLFTWVTHILVSLYQKDTRRFLFLKLYFRSIPTAFIAASVGIPFFSPSADCGGPGATLVPFPPGMTVESCSWFEAYGFSLALTLVFFLIFAFLLVFWGWIMIRLARKYAWVKLTFEKIYFAWNQWGVVAFSLSFIVFFGLILFFFVKFSQ